MSPENHRYFTQKDIDFSSVLPSDCNWQRLVEHQEILSPSVTIEALRLAENFLVTAPGPNLHRRLQQAPLWFDRWFGILNSIRSGQSQDGYVKEEGILPFDRVYARLHNEFDHWESAGVLFVAGAEGHEGHIHAAQWMKDHVYISVWTFEQDNYFERAGKVRRNPLLPLPIRLSMWAHFGLWVTVSPEKPAHLSDERHYKKLFDRMGPAYAFADESDPLCQQKIARGRDACFLRIPHLPVFPTTPRVEYLFSNEDSQEEDEDEWFRSLALQPDDSFLQI